MVDAMERMRVDRWVHWKVVVMVGSTAWKMVGKMVD